MSDNTSKPNEFKSTMKRRVEDVSASTDKDNSGKKNKTELEMNKPATTKGFSIKIGQPTQKKVDSKTEMLKKPSVFDDDTEEELEEMPPEARMRMKNIGRDTQTSSGPNSFGKTRQGFCDSKKIFERQLKKTIEESGDS